MNSNIRKLCADIIAHHETIDKCTKAKRALESRLSSAINTYLITNDITARALQPHLSCSLAHLHALLNGHKRMTPEWAEAITKAVHKVQFPND